MRVQRTRDETLHEKMENVNSSEFSTSCNRELLSLISHYAESCIHSFLLPFGFKALRTGGEGHGSYIFL